MQCRITDEVVHVSSALVEQTGLYKGPALFIAAGKSSYLLPEHHAVIKQYFPNSVIETVPNAGHWVHASNPDDFTRLVGQFLNRTDKRVT